MGLFDDLLTQPKPILDAGQFQQPTGFGTTTTATPTGTINPFNALIAKLFAGPTQTSNAKVPDFGSLLAALRTVPHYGISGNSLANGSTGGLTPEADWRRMFPTHPTGY